MLYCTPVARHGRGDGFNMSVSKLLEGPKHYRKLYLTLSEDIYCKENFFTFFNFFMWKVLVHHTIPNSHCSTTVVMNNRVIVKIYNRLQIVHLPIGAYRPDAKTHEEFSYPNSIITLLFYILLYFFPLPPRSHYHYSAWYLSRAAKIR